jgi:hypothetical protein
MSFRSSALIWLRSGACVTLLAVMAACSSAPQSSAPGTTSPTTAPQSSAKPIESPTAAPQSIPQSIPQPSPESPKSDASPSSNSASSKAARTVEKCVIRMAKVNDPESPLNVRSSPNASSQIVGQLPNGAFVDVENEQDGWFKITGEKPGWIAKSRTESNCGEKVERVEFAKGQDMIEIVDRFIGVGSHTYRFNLGKGQTLTVTRDRQVFPRIVAPDGKDLVEYREDRKSWTGEVAATGDYEIIFDSNYKGYEYAVSVEAR